MSWKAYLWASRNTHAHAWAHTHTHTHTHITGDQRKLSYELRSKAYLPQLNTFKGTVAVWLLKSCLTQQTRLPCPSPSTGICSNSCPLRHRCRPTIAFSVTPFSSCPQTFLVSGSFLMSQLFASGVASKKLGILLCHEICWLSMIMTVFEGLKKSTSCDWKYISLN